MPARPLAAVTAVLLFAAATTASAAPGDVAPSPDRFPIRVKGAWGFIDAAGKVKVKPSYTAVGDFDRGRANVVKGTKVGVIDPDGKVLVPLTYTWLGAFAQDRQAARIGDAECGYLDAAGAWAFHIDGCEGARLGDFSDGLAAVVAGGKTRYYDPAGKLAITVDGEGDLFLAGVASVEVAGKRTPIDHAGKPLTLPAGADELIGGFWDGLPAPIMIGRICKRGLCYGAWGLVDPSMKVVVAPQFRMAPRFADGLAAAVVDFDPGYGYIDATGKVVIPYQFKYADDFAEGLAWVEGHDGRHAVIDRNGAFVIPWRDDISSTAPFLHGLSAPRLTSGRYQVIDRTGKQVALLPVGAYTAGWTGDLIGYYTAKKKLVYVDRRGKTVWKER